MYKSNSVFENLDFFLLQMPKQIYKHYVYFYMNWV